MTDTNSNSSQKSAVKKLRTGFRYPRGPWKGMTGQIYIVVEQGYISAARYEDRANDSQLFWANDTQKGMLQ